MRRFRYVNEVAGLAVLVAIGLLGLAALQSAALREWVNPSATLRIMLPPDGSSGLAPGSPVEILGTRAGQIQRIVIRPDQSLYAEAKIAPDAQSFIRRDSKALIRKQFGIAGATYIEITRGSEGALDWSFAVIEAQSERAPTENVGQLIDDLRTRVFPILDDTQATLAAVRSIVERIDRGEGNVGRLLVDDTLARSLERTATSLEARVGEMQAVMASAARAADGAATAAGAVAGQSEALARTAANAAAISDSLRRISADLAKATPEAPGTARNLEATTATLPALLVQTQGTLQEVQLLVEQLRGSWLLGGAAAPPAAGHLDAAEVR